ncbi:Oligopeptide transport ATP-binding protein oppD [Staphylococcus aureus]|nr:Oligopeptide transport ATP-binding protein oppD [Staphylococcus aureus]
MNNVLLEVKDLETSLKINNEWLATVENISFELSKGEVLGIVGVNSGLKMLFYGGLKMSFFSGLRLSYI